MGKESEEEKDDETAGPVWPTRRPGPDLLLSSLIGSPAPKAANQKRRRQNGVLDSGTTNQLLDAQQGCQVVAQHHGQQKTLLNAAMGSLTHLAPQLTLL